MRKILIFSLILGAGLFADGLTKSKAISFVCKKKVVDGECSCENFKFFKTEFPYMYSITAEKVIFGNFVKSNEAIVTTIGCEERSLHSGGYMFFRQVDDKWHLIKYSGIRLGIDCKIVRLSKKDGLICDNGFFSHGILGTILNLYTFDKNHQLHTEKLYEGQDNSAEVGENDKRYKNTSIKNWMLWEENGKTHLIIKANDNNYKRERTKTIEMILE